MQFPTSHVGCSNRLLGWYVDTLVIVIIGNYWQVPIGVRLGHTSIFFNGASKETLKNFYKVDHAKNFFMHIPKCILWMEKMKLD
jgi:hypothetical protein